MDARRTYWLEVAATAAAGLNEFRWQRTRSDDESGLPGWTIADGAQSNSALSQMFRVNAVAIGEACDDAAVCNLLGGFTPGLLGVAKSTT